jgi:serine/threonine protein kinase/tetratricopeptide (TPR) repeat protein
MTIPLAIDEQLLQSLPLPLAQLYRRSHNAKTSLDRHLTAFSLWEAALKLLASVAIVEYAALRDHDPELTERLQNLARPSLGHWWEFVRRLLPVLADRDDREFQKVRDLILGRTRDDFPHAAGLDAALAEALNKKGGSRSTVRFTELFDRLVEYRNKVIGHAAPGQLKGDFNERMARALLAGLAEILGRLDVLVGRQLTYVAEVRQSAGIWLVQRYELIGESARRIESLELPRDAADRLPDGERVYLDNGLAAGASPAIPALHSLHPLVLYDAETGEVLFLNSRRGRKRTEYLCYTSGRPVDRPDLGIEQRELLARVLGMEVAPEQAEQWAARSQADEPADQDSTPGADGRRGDLASAESQTLGEFELLSELGRGGMGVVYRAWQPSLRRQVALKKLLHCGDSKTEARFRREIRALGRVEHPHLVKVFTSGSDSDQWFYAMELVEGAPLSAVCDKLQKSSSSVSEVDGKAWQAAVSTVCQEARQAEKPLSDSSHDKTAQPGERPPFGARDQNTLLKSPPSLDGSAPPSISRSYVHQVAELMGQVADAAHALHEHGVIHRDIKPGNIIVSAGGSQAVLMDLGLAQLADDVEGRLTRTRKFVGTLRYASPEQVLAVGTLDRRTDVYSLGATLWELLTLRPMFGATEQTPDVELMKRIQHEEPQRLRKHHPGIPRDLDAIVLKCLEKEENKRYPTAHELARDLRRFLAHEPVRARPVSEMGRLWRWCRRNPMVAGLVSAVLMLLVVLTVSSVWAAIHWKRLADKAEEAAEREKQAYTEAVRARIEVENNFRLASEFVDRYFTEVSENVLANEPRQEHLRKKLLEAAREAHEKLIKKRGDNPNLQVDLAKALDRLASINRLLEHTDEARRSYENALVIWNQLLGQEPKKVEYLAGKARTLLGLGNVFARTQPDQAKDRYQQALDIRKDLVHDHPKEAEHKRDLAVSYSNLGALHQETHHPDQALTAYQQAEKIQEDLLHDKDLVHDSLRIRKYQADLARTRYNLGRLYVNKKDVNKKDMAQAQASFESALAIWNELILDDPDVPLLKAHLVDTSINLAVVYDELRELDKAGKTYQQISNVIQELTEDHPKVPDYQRALGLYYNNLGRHYRLTSQLAQSEKAYQEALTVRTKLAEAYSSNLQYKSDLERTRKDLEELRKMLKKQAKNSP